PRNSFLNDVLERRVGIPITLALLYVAVGERAGLPVRGVGLPGHFLVKYAPASSGEIFIDAFNGRTLSRQECAKMIEDMYGGAAGARGCGARQAAAWPADQPAELMARLGLVLREGLVFGLIAGVFSLVIRLVALLATGTAMPNPFSSFVTTALTLLLIGGAG